MVSQTKMQTVDPTNPEAIPAILSLLSSHGTWNVKDVPYAHLLFTRICASHSL